MRPCPGERYAAKPLCSQTKAVARALRRRVKAGRAQPGMPRPARRSPPSARGATCRGGPQAGQSLAAGAARMPRRAASISANGGRHACSRCRQRATSSPNSGGSVGGTCAADGEHVRLLFCWCAGPCRHRPLAPSTRPAAPICVLCSVGGFPTVNFMRGSAPSRAQQHWWALGPACKAHAQILLACARHSQRRQGESLEEGHFMSAAGHLQRTAILVLSMAAALTA